MEFTHQGSGEPDFASIWKLNLSDTVGTDTNVLLCYAASSLGYVMIPGMAGAGGFVKNAANGLLSGNNNVVNGDLGNLGTAGKLAKFAATGLADSVITEASSNLQIPTTSQFQFRDTALYISSKNDGYLDFDADTGFRFNTGKVGIGTLYPGWSPSLNANDSVLSIVTKSPGYEAYLELCGNVADTGGSGGVINFMNLDNSSAANYKHVSIGAITIGATAHHRGADLVFYTKPDNGTITEKLRINSVGNVGIGTSIFGTNSVGELCIANGTAPTALVANAIQIFSVDSSDNAATLGLFLEQAMTSDGNTRYLKIKINGEELIWQLTLVT
jgi:hypothetical protein